MGRYRLRAMCFLASMLLIVTSSANADERDYNLSTWKQYQTLKRQQIREMCDLWFASFRPGSVGKTYLNAAEQMENIDLNGCSVNLRKFINHSKRSHTKVAEVLGSGGGISDLNKFIDFVVTKNFAVLHSKEADERGDAIFKMIKDLWNEEEKLVAELKLDE